MWWRLFSVICAEFCWVISPHQWLGKNGKCRVFCFYRALHFPWRWCGGCRMFWDSIAPLWRASQGIPFWLKLKTNQSSDLQCFCTERNLVCFLLTALKFLPTRVFPFSFACEETESWILFTVLKTVTASLSALDVISQCKFFLWGFPWVKKQVVQR